MSNFVGKMDCLPCDCPCRGCENRLMGCHENCQAYIKYKKDIEDYRAREHEQKTNFSLSLPLKKKRRH